MEEEVYTYTNRPRVSNRLNGMFYFQACSIAIFFILLICIPLVICLVRLFNNQEYWPIIIFVSSVTIPIIPFYILGRMHRKVE